MGEGSGRISSSIVHSAWKHHLHFDVRDCVCLEARNNRDEGFWEGE